MKLLFAILVLVGSCWAYPPILFDQDYPTATCTAISPNGVNGKGTIVTVYGNFFGASQGASSIKLGSTVLDSILLWSNTKIAFQPKTTAGGCPTVGDYKITVVTSLGTSNTLSLHIFDGASNHIYFMDPNASGASDGNDGLTPTVSGGHGPFSTNQKCLDSAFLVAGNVCYMMPGSWNKTPNGCSGACYLDGRYVFGSATAYSGVSGYPTSDSSLVAKVGCDFSTSGCTTGVGGLRTWLSAWQVYSNLHLMVADPPSPGDPPGYGAAEIGSQDEGQYSNVYGSGMQIHDIRVIGNELTAPQHYAFLVTSGDASFYTIAENNMHDTCTNGTTQTSQHNGDIYNGDASHDYEISHNIFDDSSIWTGYNCQTAKPIEIHSTGKTSEPMLQAPVIQAGGGSTNGDVFATSGGSLPNGSYDVRVSWGSTETYGNTDSSYIVPPFESETPISSLVTVSVNGTSTTAIKITHPLGYDYMHPIIDAREYDGVSNLCNPMRKYNVYVGPHGGTLLWQGSGTYGTTLAGANSTMAGATDFTLTTLVTTPSTTNHEYITPQNGFGGTPSPGQHYLAYQSGCRQYNIAVHDNQILYAPNYSMPWAHLNPTRGYVKVYNNVVHNSGNNWNWNTPGGPGDPVCIALPEPGDDGHEGPQGGQILFYNNDFYNCGVVQAYPLPVNGLITASWNDNYDGNPVRELTFINNVMVQPETGQVFIAADSSTGSANLVFDGSNNLCWGPSGANCPASFNSGGGGKNFDPLFTDNGTRATRGGTDPNGGVFGPIYEIPNLVPQGTSQAVGNGVACSGCPTHDITGLLRPTPPSIGAYESSGASSVPQSTITGKAKMKGTSKTKP